MKWKKRATKAERALREAEYERDLNGEMLTDIRRICRERGVPDHPFADDNVTALAKERDVLRAALVDSLRDGAKALAFFEMTYGKQTLVGKERTE